MDSDLDGVRPDSCSRLWAPAMRDERQRWPYPPSARLLRGRRAPPSESDTWTARGDPGGARYIGMDTDPRRAAVAAMEGGLSSRPGACSTMHSGVLYIPGLRSRRAAKRRGLSVMTLGGNGGRLP